MENLRLVDVFEAGFVNRSYVVLQFVVGSRKTSVRGVLRKEGDGAVLLVMVSD
jgi:hypothetical protein